MAETIISVTEYPRVISASSTPINVTVNQGGVPGPPGSPGSAGPAGTGSSDVWGLISTGDADLRYYSISNPSGYLTGFNSGIYITTGQTGQFYPYSNPLSFSSSGNVANTGEALQNQINGINNRSSFTGTLFISTSNLNLISNSANTGIILSGNSINVYGNTSGIFPSTNILTVPVTIPTYGGVDKLCGNPDGFLPLYLSGRLCRIPYFY